jgi:hypothetical protein
LTKSDCCNLRDMTAEADYCCKLVNDRRSRDPFTPEVLLAEQITVFTYVPTALTGLGFHPERMTGTPANPALKASSAVRPFSASGCDHARARCVDLGAPLGAEAVGRRDG